MQIFSKENNPIQTKDQLGNHNGFVLPIYNINDSFVSLENRPEQVYLTVVDINKSKGPHLHLKRQGMFTCVKGNIKLVIRIDGKYIEYLSGEQYQYRTIQVPPGVPALLINIGSEPAFVLNMPCPAWTKQNPDENYVDFDDYIKT